MRSRFHTFFYSMAAASAFGDTKEEPVGLVLSAAGSKLLRADTETPLGARAGDLLFAGDGLSTETRRPPSCSALRRLSIRWVHRAKFVWNRSSPK